MPWREPGHDVDHRQARDKQSEPFDPRRPARAYQQGTVKNVLEHLGMNLDARHAFAEGRRLIIDESDSGNPDEHDLALDLSAVDLPAEHICGRDEAACIVRRIVYPEAPVRLSAHSEI